MEIQGLVIRKASISEASGVKACVEADYNHYICRLDKPPGPLLENYNDVIQKHQVFIARVGDDIIGVIVLILQKKELLLDNVAVHPHYQGKGLGRYLIELAEKEAKQQGYKEIYLYTNERMIENIQLYNYLGYIETERLFENGRMRVYMHKLLTTNIMNNPDHDHVSC